MLAKTLTVLLSDIVVYEDAVLPTAGSPKIVNARNCGIGSKLMKRFLSHCDAASVKTIFGNVPESADKQPFLRGWYISKGFEVAQPNTIDNGYGVPFKVAYQIIRMHVS